MDKFVEDSISYYRQVPAQTIILYRKPKKSIELSLDLFTFRQKFRYTFLYNHCSTFLHYLDIPMAICQSIFTHKHTLKKKNDHFSQFKYYVFHIFMLTMISVKY